MSEPPRYYYERRRGPDKWVRAVQIFGLVGWILIFASWYIVDQAKPPFESIIEKVFKIQLRETWDKQLLSYSFYLNLLIIFICIISLVINSKRCRRKSDRYNPAVIFLLILSVISAILYVVFFL